MIVGSVLFDLTGTLVWSEPPGETLFCEACDLLGFHVSPSELYRATAEVDRTIHVPLPATRKEEADFFAYGHMSALHKVGIDATVSHGWFIHHYIQDRMRYHKFFDVDTVLSCLKETGLKLGVVANAAPSTRERIANLGLDVYLDTIILSGEVGFEKPEPQIFKAALRILGVSPQETVYVGDTYHTDVEGAFEAGIIPVLLDRSQSYEPLDCLKVKSLTEFQEMMSIFK
ncbi:MAG: HAD-IA family hydrolase [Theionarchaea archaeon]|nr:HAD-IA family hydrolase [Theionarchaea archaeon]MBU7002019.1 HAD-IA family hydrolase [Theionarchaea archaeon]MBU7021856.1 HAD-IA family hydrolase [Theionarchaea archaeon]MBU7036033.1 HAD-IA family hydrolase [Theionarchaea archaeon]MBU7040907.1 HAD-IA family hydrolase [Theionarchaea archaeon]